MVVKGTCGLCQGGCQIIMTIEDGKLVKVAPDTESPKGRLCARGALAPKMLYGEQRIKKPLIRTGARGEGKFQEVSWEEAFAYAAKLLKKTAEEFGGRSLAAYWGRGVLGTPVTRFSKSEESLLAKLGSPNDMSCSSICNMASSMVTPITTMGIGTRMMVQEIETSEYIIAWGKNSATDDGPQMMLKRIKAAKERGAKLIVIDPRKTGLGEIADIWVPVMPGADGALALGMLKIIIAKEKYEKDFVEKYTKGFDEFKTYLDSLTLEQLSDWCGISVKEIEELVDIFCSTEKISLVSYTGLEYQASAIQNNRAVFMLWALTGKLDTPGAIYLHANGVPTFKPKELPKENVPIGVKEYPFFYKFTGLGQFSCTPKAILKDDPYPVRGLLIVGGSPILSFPDQNTWTEAYKKLECLIVVDRFMTEDARFADLVLPACSFYEVPKMVPTENGLAIEDPVIAPVEEAKNDVLIISGIAKALGMEGFPQTEDEVREWLKNGVAPFANDFRVKQKTFAKKYKKYETGELRADGQPGFPTPSGKFEICSTYLAENGFTPYPEYVDIRSLKGLEGEEFPFLMTSGARSNNRMGVLGANIEGIAAIEPDPLVEICPEDAKDLGVENGDLVKVTTPFGSESFKVRVCGVAKHAIHIPHGGGSAYMPESWKEGNVNRLCSLDYTDPVTGFVLIKSVPCKIEKVK